MNPLDYQRDGESVRDCIDRYERCTGRDYGLELAASFDAADGVFAVELPSIETLRALSWRHAIHPKDAARDASFGYSVERELAEVGPEPSDLLTECAACGDEFEGDYHDQYLCDVCQMSAVS
jgi:hypothetical protein